MNHHLSIDVGAKRPYIVEVTSHDMPLQGLPTELYGATVVQLSDFHAGFAGLDAVYHRAAEVVGTLDPDLILITGDYVDDSVKGDYPIERHLCRFRARLGVYGSFGNHDYRRGVVGTRKMLERSGVKVLLNEGERVGPGLWVAGIDDDEYGRPDLVQALQDVPPETTALVMSHNPRVFDRVGEHNIQMLAGHTHGGQICPVFPSSKVICMVHLRCRQVAGWYRNGKARLYVNRGLGVTGRPFRYRCHAEIAVFRLVPAAVNRHLRHHDAEEAQSIARV